MIKQKLTEVIELLTAIEVNTRKKIPKQKLTKIADLLLSPRTRNVLHKFYGKKFNTLEVDELGEVSERALRKVKQCGAKTMHELKEVMKELNLEMLP